MSSAIFVGMDVSQETADVAVQPGTAFRITNEAQGITEAVGRVQALQPILIVIEATGGLKVPLARALAAVGLPVVVINPRQANFARATGQPAKTDQLDAQVLARFPESIHPPVRPTLAEQTQALAALVARRGQLIEMLTAEKNQLRLAARPIQKRILAHITWLRQEFTRINTDLTTTMQQSPVCCAREDVLRSVPGVGPVLTRILFPKSSRPGHLNAQRNRCARGRRAVPARQRHPQRSSGDLG